MPPARRAHLPPTIRAGLGLVVLGLLWSGGWLVGARVAGTALDSWIAAEAAAGRQWNCPERRFEGYPFALRVRCTRPTFRGEVAGHTADGIVEALSAGIAIEHWDRLEVTLKGPLNLRAEDDAFIAELNWDEAMNVSIPGLWRFPSGGSVAAQRFALSISAPRQGDVNLRAALLSGEAEAVAATPADMRFAFSAKGVTFPTLDPVPGLDGPADADGQGVLVGATRLGAPTVARLEAWRTAGGALRIDRLAFRQGSFSGTASGTLALDAAHRPAGRLDTRLVGFEPIAKAFGIPLEGVRIGGLLMDLLGGGSGAADAAGSIRLPLVVSEGGVKVGPLATGVRVLPIY